MNKKNNKIKYTPPDFISEALKVLKPPDKLTVSEWADRNRILDTKTSAMPGRWRTDHTPYLRMIMDSWSNSAIERITFVKPTQVGGTECANNIIAYSIAQDPSPCLVVYPQIELAEFTSDNRLQPMIELCKAIRDKFDIRSKKLELQFDDMYIVLAGAQSPSSLASRPIRYLIMDEVDKYPATSGKEADPRSLAVERTKTFKTNRKIYQTSTPVFKTGPIWQEWESADTQYEYFVPCPHCGEYQTLKFPNIRWENESGNAILARKTAVYSCEFCGGVMENRDINNAVKAGEWRVIRTNGSRLHSAFRINAIYSPWVTLGDVAYEFKKSKNDPMKLMNFYNSWLAEPWEQIDGSVDAEKLLEKTSRYQRGEIPKDTILITGGVDVQKKCFYYTVRAWRADMTNFNIDHGRVETWQELTAVMNREYIDPSTGQVYIINLACVDSGDQTDDVYEYCALNREWAFPVKGSSKKLVSRFSISKIDKLGSRANGMNLGIVDTEYYKDSIFARILRTESGGFYVYDDCDLDYINQITSEHKITEKKNGRLVSVWVPKKTHADNHYLDCEVYAACAADILGIRQIQVDAYETENQTEPESYSSSPQKNGGWIARDGNWI